MHSYRPEEAITIADELIKLLSSQPMFDSQLTQPKKLSHIHERKPRHDHTIFTGVNWVAENMIEARKMKGAALLALQNRKDAMTEYVSALVIMEAYHGSGNQQCQDLKAELENLAASEEGTD